MNRDLTYILNGQLPRGYGEMPSMMDNYEMIAPSAECDRFLKLIGGEKMFGSTMKVSEKINPEAKSKVRGLGSMPSAQEQKAQAAAISAAIPKANA